MHLIKTSTFIGKIKSMKWSSAFLLFFVPVVCILFSACEEHPQTIPAVKQPEKSQRPITIESFSVSPETDSCSCLFSIDSATFKKSAYVLAYDLETIAFMKLNGHLVKFRQTEYFGAGNNSVTTFESDPYTLYLEIKDVNEIGKEATLISGSIRVMDKGNVALTTFYGECSCKNPKIPGRNK